MTRIVIQDDVVIRAFQVLLDPDTDPERQAAFADYYSVGVDDFEGWRASVRERFSNVYPATVVTASSQQEFDEALADADGAVVESLQFGPDQLARAPGVRMIHKFGTDTRNIDAAACEQRGVAVASVRRRVNVAVAEHAFALMLGLGKKIVSTDRLLTIEALQAAGYPARQYDRRHSPGSNWARVDGILTLSGATIGIFGLGEIGREMASRADAFGMEVLYYQRNRLAADAEAEFNAGYVPLDDLLARSDVISVHLPLNDSTRGILGRDQFARVKPGALLVNISRAEIIDHGALVAALKDGRLGGAGLDVHYTEPGDGNDPLEKLPNTILTPHTAVASRINGALDMEEMIANFDRALA